MIRITPEYKCISFLMPKTTCIHNEVCKNYCYLNKYPYPQSVMDEINNENLEEKKTAELFNDWDRQFENFLKMYNSFSWAEMAGKFRVIFHTMGDFPMSSEYLLAVMKLVNKYDEDFDFVVFTRHRPSSDLPIWDILDDKLKIWISLDSLLYYEKTGEVDKDVWSQVLTGKDSLYDNGYRGGVAQRYHSEEVTGHFGAKYDECENTCTSCNIFKKTPCTQKNNFHLFMTEPEQKSGIDVKLSDIIAADFDELERKLNTHNCPRQKNITDDKLMESRRDEKTIRDGGKLTEEKLREYLKDVKIVSDYRCHGSGSALSMLHGEEHDDECDIGPAGC